jgi:hypothetical protein
MRFFALFFCCALFCCSNSNSAENEKIESYTTKVSSQFSKKKSYNNTSDSRKNDEIIVQHSSSKCRMRLTCKINVLIRKSLSIDSLIIESDESIFLFDTIKQDSGNMTTDEEYDCFTIDYQAKMIGKSSLIIKSKQNQSVLASVEIIVAQYRQKIDTVFDIWVWSFQIIISLIMGVLLDTESLIKIIKMPIPVAIGFGCQSLFMPLVFDYSF